MQSIKPLKNIFEGEDVYILASGASMNFFDSEFFADRATLAVNRMWKFFEPDYVVVKHSDDAVDVPYPVIASKFDCGVNGAIKNEADYIFDHNMNGLDKIDFPNDEEDIDRIIVSWSTITSAIHMAAYMGARAIFLCGHDCGTIDGQETIDNYLLDTSESNRGDYRNWLSEIESQTVTVRDWVLVNYGCPVHSINPFVSLNLEGHIYD